MLEINARAVTNYLNAQIEAGAQAVMIFDTWGGILADGPYQRFSLAYMRRILSELTPHRKERNEKGETVLESVPTILFTKGGAPWLEALAASGADAIGIDWTMNLAPARIGRTVAVQRADGLFTHLFGRGEERHGVEVALQHAGGAHTLARRGQVHGPVDTNGIGAAGGQGLQPGGRHPW